MKKILLNLCTERIIKQYKQTIVLLKLFCKHLATNEQCIKARNKIKRDNSKKIGNNDKYPIDRKATISECFICAIEYNDMTGLGRQKKKNQINDWLADYTNCIFFEYGKMKVAIYEITELMDNCVTVKITMINPKKYTEIHYICLQHKITGIVFMLSGQ